jgi:sugar phosphate isomerase/epimerase
MWEISLFSDDIYSRDRSFEANLALLQRLGVRYTDLRIIDGVNILDLSDEDLDGVRRMLAKYGMKVAGLATPLFKCSLRNPQGPAWGSRHGFKRELSYQEHAALLPRAFQIADKLGATNIRCFPFWREFPLEDVLDEVVDKLGRAAEVARRSGHALALENEHNQLAATGVELARLLKAINSPYMKGIYDLGNSWRRGGIPYPDDVNALKGLITHVHVKPEVIEIACGCTTHSGPTVKDDEGGFCLRFIGDWDRTETPISGRLKIGGATVEIVGRKTFVPVTDTVYIDHRAVLAALKRDGYTGFIAIDSDYRGPEAEINLQRSVESLRALIADVWDRS